MRIFLLCSLMVWVCHGSATGLDRKDLERAKSMTVLVAIQSHLAQGQWRAGVGVVVKGGKKDGRDLWCLVTSSHLFSHAETRRQGQIINGYLCYMIFNSGRPDQFVLPVGGMFHYAPLLDLATCTFSNPKLTKTLEKPLPYSTRPPKETESVSVLGFPFFHALTQKDGHPEATVSQGAVSSLRKNSEGVVESVQLDVKLNPGSMGGPVLTDKGTLIGIAQSGIDGTKLSFATPMSYVDELLDGTVGGVRAVANPTQGHPAVETWYASPLFKLEKARLRVIVADKPQTFARGRKGWSKLRNARYTSDWEPFGSTRFARWKIPAAKLGSKEGLVQLYCQVEAKGGRQSSVCSAPTPFVWNGTTNAFAAGLVEDFVSAAPGGDDWLANFKIKGK